MKRIIISILFLAFLSIFTHYQITYAADTFEVSADNSMAKIIEDDRYLIPVNLYNNSGIMGFRVTLAYDSQKVRIISISRGLITSEGNFVTNISDLDGTADIIWNHTADVKRGSGSLFLITAEKLSDDLTIDVSFSQPDTFNEKYKDVCLKCKTIDIKKEVQTKLETEKLAGLEESAESQDADISSEKEAEQNALNDYVKHKNEWINNIPESEDKFKERVISQLKKKGYKTIQDIPNDKKGEFIKDVKDHLRNTGYTIKDISDETIKNAIDNLVITDEEYDMYDEKDASVFQYCTAIISTIIILITVYVCHKKYVTKKMEGKNEERN